MEPVAIAFGIGLLITGVYALGSPQRGLSLMAWAWLAIGWLTSVLAAPSGDKYAWLFMAMDTIFGTVVMTIAHRKRSMWLAILGLTFLGEMVIHVLYNFLSVDRPTDPARVRQYFMSLNVVFASQLVCVAFPGAVNGVTILLDRMRRLSRHSSRSSVAP